MIITKVAISRTSGGDSTMSQITMSGITAISVIDTAIIHNHLSSMVRLILDQIVRSLRNISIFLWLRVFWYVFRLVKIVMAVTAIEEVKAIAAYTMKLLSSGIASVPINWIVFVEALFGLQVR